jgi:hypothetical protein
VIVVVGEASTEERTVTETRETEPSNMDVKEEPHANPSRKRDPNHLALEELRGELANIKSRSIFLQSGAALLGGVITALFTYWVGHERNELDSILEGERRTQAKTLDDLQRQHAKELAEQEQQHRERLSRRQDITENRKINFEIVRQVTPALISGKPNEAQKALAIVGALDAELWRPISQSVLAKENPLAPTVQRINEVRATRFNGRQVSCDRASSRTTSVLKGDWQSEADQFCRTVKVVPVLKSEPYQWPDGSGLTFPAEHRIDNVTIWCSCFFDR